MSDQEINTPKYVPREQVESDIESELKELRSVIDQAGNNLKSEDNPNGMSAEDLHDLRVGFIMNRLTKFTLTAANTFGTPESRYKAVTKLVAYYTELAQLIDMSAPPIINMTVSSPGDEGGDANLAELNKLGFKDLDELTRMVAEVDLTSEEKIKAFKEWQTNDGSKAGLEKLPVASAGSNIPK